MKRLGKVHLLSRSGNLILRSKTVPRLREDVFDSSLDLVGTVNDVFGPATNPFVSVSPKRDGPELLVGHLLYLMRSKKRSSRKVYGWKGKNN